MMSFVMGIGYPPLSTIYPNRIEPENEDGNGDETDDVDEDENGNEREDIFVGVGSLLAVVGAVVGGLLSEFLLDVDAVGTDYPDTLELIFRSIFTSFFLILLIQFAWANEGGKSTVGALHVGIAYIAASSMFGGSQTNFAVELGHVVNDDFDLGIDFVLFVIAGCVGAAAGGIGAKLFSEAGGSVSPA